MTPGTAPGPAPARPAPPRLALTTAQQRLWFLDRMDPGTPTYNIAYAVRFAGPLDAEALHRAFQVVVARHEALRTVFPAVDGAPEQRILPLVEVPLAIVDLAPLPAGRRQEEAARLIREEGSRPFDLARGPLLRTTLLRLALDEHTLLLTVHHIVFDGWSEAVLARELAEAYEAYASGAEPDLGESPASYAEVSRRQAAARGAESLARDLAFWKERLAGAPALLELPADRPRPARQSHRGAIVPVRIDAPLAGAMSALARAEGVSLFMVLAAALATVLRRQSGQEDVSLGIPVAGRTIPEAENVIGLFVNTLVLRSDLSGNPTFRELLVRVRDAALSAYEHQEVPIEKLVEELAPGRSLAHAPLFQVMLAFQNIAGLGLRLPGLVAEPLRPDTGAARFDLTFFVAETPRGLAGVLEYATDLFDRATAERLVRQLVRVLGHVTESPDARVEEVPLLDAEERRRITEEWNLTGADVPRETLPQAVARRLADRPDAPAVVFGGTVLTARELDERSARLARRLRALGAGPDVPVGLSMERSADMVVGLLGILRAGSGYVPLDPGYPTERLATMLADSGAPLLVTQAAIAPRFAGAGARTVLFERDEDAPGTPLPDTAPDHLAYLIYTSGSTGRPKGVEVPHRALGNLLQHFARALPAGPGDVLVSVTTLSFDIAGLELWLPLLTGGRLVVASREEAADGLALAGLIARSGATIFQATPTTYRLLVETGWAGSPALTLLCGGEMVPRDLATELLPRCRELWNVYGPTETTIWSAMDRVSAGEEAVPIGRPIANTRLYVVDAHGEPVPVGVPGELLIGGEGVARGYHGRPDLTAERFVPDPFSARAGARLYRTGDRARFLADGRVEVLGRFDQQVKLRGFRIEPGEIEAALAAHPGVAQCAVALRGAGADQRLVAWVVGAGGAPPRPAELREHLARLLPDYMIPSVVVPLAALPLTPNRKVDRAALPDPGPESEPGATRAPADAAEEKVVALFREVLGRPGLGPDDDFFEAGGHSLLAVRLVGRIEKAFGKRLPLATVFTASTPAALATHVRGATAAAPAAADAPAAGDAAPESYPLTPLQHGMLFQTLYAADSGVDVEQMVCDLDETLDRAAFRRAWDLLVARHDALRTEFDWEGRPEPLQRVRRAVAVPWSEEDLSGCDAAEQERRFRLFLEADRRKGFDLRRAPLLRITLFRLGDARWRAVWTFHHVILDGRSFPILLRELFRSYDAGRAGAPPPPLPAPRPYRDYIAWLSGRDDARDEAFWRSLLAGYAAPRPLAAGPRPAPPPPGEPVDAEVGRALDAGLTKRLHEMAERHGLTLNTLVQGAWAILLSRYLGEEDVAFGATRACRSGTVPGAGEMIGLFINTLPVRARVSPEGELLPFLKELRAQSLALRAHEPTPLVKVQEWSEVPRGAALFETIVVYDNARLTTRMAAEGPAFAGRRFKTLTRTGYPLCLGVFAEEALLFELTFDRRRISAGSATRLLAHLETLLAAFLATPEARLGDLPLLDGGERDEILRRFNEPLDPLAADAEPFLAAFEARVDARPEATAVAWETGRLSYRALDERANGIARHLRRRGAGPGDLVAVALERSPDLVASLLGILKAGAAWVPLDLSHPAERLARIAAGARLVLTREALAGPLAPRERAVLLDADGAAIAGEGVERLGLAPGGEDPAYVITTSGTSGTPKGVEVPVSALSRFVAGATATYGVAEDDVVLQFASIGFDTAVEEIFVTLAAGATLRLRTDGMISTVREFLETSGGWGITVLDLPTAFWHEVVAALATEGLRLPPSVRTVIIGGERARPEAVRTWLERVGEDVALLNTYGPTETTVVATACRLTRDAVAPGAPVPIGRPLPGVRAYVLSAGGQPAPGGVVGELHVGGSAVARGYRGQPELTAQRFVPDPFGAPGGRMYRTGDLARFRPDGLLEFCGRTDLQVKIRGFRVEPAEIESALRQHPEVHEAVVVPRGEGSLLRLVAYVVPSRPPGPTPADLRCHVGRLLPPYMVPSAIVSVPAIPVNANGKLDRAALPDGEGDAAEAGGAGYVAPRDAVETGLAEIWTSVLKVPRVGAHDDYFELGGHSLLALQIISRIERTFAQRVPLATLFQARTVAQLAEVVRAGRAGSVGS